MLDGGPVGDEVGVGDQDSWGVLRGSKNAHWLSRLYEERLVVFELSKRVDDLVEAFPVACCLAGAAVYDEFCRILGYFRIEVVHEQAQWRLGHP